MVSQRESRRPEGNGRNHQVSIRGPSTRARHGDSRQPATSGFATILNGLLKKELGSYIEPVLRRVLVLSFFFHSHAPLQTANPPTHQNAFLNILQVRQEVERLTQEYLFPRTTPCQGGSSGAKTLELRFVNEPPETIFTHTDVISEDEKTSLQIALFDVISESVVSTGPLSSAKVEISALDGDFCPRRCEDRTEEEFNANILFPREGKEPLLSGVDRIITLKNGVGSITKIKFTDNSRWRRSRKFGLGAKVLQPTSCRASIKEGVSKPFVVKDNRGELYKKHHPPCLDDDVWRLEKIAKDGKIYQRLCDHGIRKVRDLVRSYNIDPSSLLEKVGKIPRKSWKAITEHAKECVIDDNNHYIYVYQTAEQSVGLLFNSIYILVGVTFDGQDYCSPDTLAPALKSLVEMVKQHAYKNLNDLKSVGDQTYFNFHRSLRYPQVGQGSGSDQGLQQLNFPIAQQGQIETWPGSEQPLISYADEGMQNGQTYASPFTDLAAMLQNSSAEGELFPGMQTEGNSWPYVESPWTENENPYIQFTSWGQENGLHFNSYGGEEFGRSEKPKAVWFKICTALKWVISVRRGAATKRMANLIHYND